VFTVKYLRNGFPLIRSGGMAQGLILGPNIQKA
jgi:hypothetical protein